MTKSDFKALSTRFKYNKQTSDDEKLVQPFAKAGENSWMPAVQRYGESLKKTKETQLDMFTNQGLMFPLAENDSAIPKQMMRGSLFAPITRGRRKAITDKQVAVFDGGEIRFSGVQLDQGDLDVLLELNALLSEFTASGNVERITNEKGGTEFTRIKFKRYSFLKRMGKTNSSKNYQKLKQSLVRLGGRLSVVIDHKGIIDGGILGNIFIDTEDGMMSVDINHRYTKLFSNNQFSFIDRKMRIELKGDFTKWLQGFVSTHSGRATYSAEKLMELSSCSTKSVRHWILRQAKPAFMQLKESGLIKDYAVKDHLFSWYK